MEDKKGEAQKQLYSSCKERWRKMEAAGLGSGEQLCWFLLRKVCVLVFPFGFYLPFLLARVVMAVHGSAFLLPSGPKKSWLKLSCGWRPRNEWCSALETPCISRLHVGTASGWKKAISSDLSNTPFPFLTCLSMVFLLCALLSTLPMYIHTHAPRAHIHISFQGQTNTNCISGK